MQFEAIPESRDWAEIVPVTAGWSREEKYHIRARDGREYLLRVVDASEAQTMRQAFAALRGLEGLPVPRAVDQGELPGKAWCLLTWLPGDDLAQALPTLSEARRYALGVQAGQILRRVHALPAPNGVPDWTDRFDAKIERKLRAYAACPLRYDGDAPLLDAVARLRPLIADRPQRFQHGDYHVGNMLLSPEGGVSVIDFNRADCGDPWEEFNRVVWSAQASPSFARGQVDGYFDGTPPERFWSLLQLYIGVNALSALPWSISFGAREIATARLQFADIRAWYDDFRTVLPRWYHSSGA